MLPKARHEDLVVQENTDELLVYDLQANKAICLNQSSAAVWQNCDGKKTHKEIAQV